jgi:hypothetical protein
MNMWFLTVLLAAQAPAPDRVIGLLSLPQVFGGTMCAPFEPNDVPLHSTPNDGTAFAFVHVDKNWSFAPHGGCEGLEVSVHRGAEHDELPTREYDYDMPGAIVLEQRSGWFRVRLREGSGWIKASITDRFMPIAELFEEFVGVTSITGSFTGQLLSEPGGRAAATAPKVGPLQSVQVLELREAGGRSFVKVDVMSHSLCVAGDKGPPEVVATGWLPLHAPSGDPTVWFSSRGC